MLGNFVLSSGYYDAYFNKAQQVRQLLVEKTNEVFESCDMIIMPNSPSTAFALGEKNQDPIAMYLSDIYTVFANLTGIPAIALPLYTHSNGMPYGLQLLGKRNDELQVLQFSKKFLKTFYTVCKLLARGLFRLAGREACRFCFTFHNA